MGPGALEVHGIDDDFLSMQPLFEDVATEFLEFVHDAELIIHNADFDVGFINHELQRLETPVQDIREHCRVLDTLALARRMHPGQRNSLDALAKRYHVDNSRRRLHGALLDAEILAEVYLAMTGGQTSLLLEGEAEQVTLQVAASPVDREGLELVVLKASEEEIDAHRQMLPPLVGVGGNADPLGGDRVVRRKLARLAHRVAPAVLQPLGRTAKMRHFARPIFV